MDVVFEQMDCQQNVIVEEHSLVNMVPSEFEQLASIKKKIQRSSEVASKKISRQKRSAMDERQERGATDPHQSQILQTTEEDCISPQQVLRGAKLEVHFHILARSSPLSSELELERRTREFRCVAFIFGDGELRVLHQKRSTRC